ncbi:RICIN domain-containing protein [Streptomyces sp. NPDC052682]|uniref:RICIN domain-containing protein n=1 Tax=Streptomyces sp. NPDC052682 TaxID=3154954 RepID=UPI0034254D11
MSREESDLDLLARAAEPGEGPRALALLLARHWRATYEYAAICLASADDAAVLAATTAFHQVLDQPADGALRPRLLAAVRDTVREWAADDRVLAVLPELRKPVGARGLRAARPGTPEKRRLAERAFLALPGASQCLLWHTYVEAEPLSVPAGLLGIDPGTASDALEQAQEQFRSACVRAHRELAPTRECRFHNRLLDVPMRRGAGLLPDVQRHLMVCRFCRQAAEQLSHAERDLGVLLADTVLGWGVRRYLDSRPGRGDGAPPCPAHGGRHRYRPRSGGRSRAPKRPAKALALGVAVAAVALLATVLAARGWSEEGGSADPGATWGAPSGHSVRPGTTPSAPPHTAGGPSAAAVGHTAEIARGRLRSLTTGLCLDVPGEHAEAGARIVLAECSSAATQQWSYRGDGRLRSAAAPTLCLHSETDDAPVVLSACLVHSGAVRYDLTVRGELLPRGGSGKPQVVAPGDGRQVRLARRDGSEAQRWALEAGRGPASGSGRAPGKGSDSSDPGERSDLVTGPRGHAPEADPPYGTVPHPPAAEPPPATPRNPSAGHDDPPQSYDKRFARVGCCAAADPDAGGPRTATPLQPVSALADTAVTAIDAVRPRQPAPGGVERERVSPGRRLSTR